MSELNNDLSNRNCAGRVLAVGKLNGSAFTDVVAAVCFGLWMAEYRM